MASGQDTPIGALISLAGKRAVVTGAAAGIGLAIARRLAEAGASIVIADNDAVKAAAVTRRLEDEGYQAVSVPGDVSRADAVADMVNLAVKQMGGIDILVNNAGIYPVIPLAEMTADDFERVIAVNLRGTFLCSREVSQRMIAQGKGGVIINLASIDALRPTAKGLAAYDASKGGVLALTRSLARELGEHDIRVNAIAPGGIATEGMASPPAAASSRPGRAQLKEFLGRTVLGRLGRADDVARVALFLASDLSAYLTGSLIVVDGGYLIT